MENISWLNKNISQASKKSVRILHEIVFGEEGDRQNRSRLRKFEGFGLEEGSEEFKQKVDDCSKKFDQEQLILVGKIFKLEADKPVEELAELLLKVLNDIGSLEESEEDSELSEEEPIQEDVGNQNAVLKKMLAQNEKLLKRLTEDKCKEYKIMPDFKANIRQFDGKGKRHVAEAWLGALEGVARLHEWPSQFKLEAARANLVGSASNWFQANEFCTWEEFEKKFRRTYIGKTDPGVQWKEMLQRVQQRKEDTEDYFQEKIRMCKALKLPFQVIKLQVIEGLWSKDLSDHLLAANHEDVDDLRDSITTYEQVNKARMLRIRKNLNDSNTEQDVPRMDKGNSSCNRYKGTTATTTPEKNFAKGPPKQAEQKLQVKCYACGKYGHISKDCPQSAKGCRKCGEDGHLAIDCKKQNNIGLVSEKTPVGAKYIKLAKINSSTLVPALIDTGACDCTIRNATARNLRLSREQMDLTLIGFGGNNCKVNEACRVVIEIEGVVGIEVRMLIVPDEAQSYEVIIGRSWLDQVHIAYCSKDGVLKIGYREGYPFKDIELNKEEDLESEIIRLNCNASLPPNSVNLVEVEAKENVLCALVKNESDHTCLLKKGEKLEKGYVLNIDKKVEDEAAREIGIRRMIKESEIKIGPVANTEERKELVDLLNTYNMCFATTTAEIGLTDKSEMDILEEPGSRPVQTKPYRVSHAEREIIADIVNEWRDAGIVSDTKSPYASPVLLVKKKNGDYRLVVDYRRLNNQTITQSFPIPNIDDQLELLAGAKLFVTLDLAHGYLQVPLSENAKEKTAFITPDEHAQFERMVFGLKNAPFEFTRLMNKVLGPLRNKVVLCYLDDLLIPAVSWSDMIGKLTKVLDTIKSAKLTLRLSKCNFGLTEIEYLGFLITINGVKPSSRKTEAISQYPRPKTAQEVRRFLGLAGFFRRFVPHFASRALALTKLTRKNEIFEWTDQQQRAFEDLKNALTTTPVLALYNPKARTEIHTDASSEGLAGIMLQEGTDRKLHLVYCVSKRTSEAEHNYHSSKLELMAIVWTLERLRQFLIGIKFTIVTDCQALVYLNSHRTKNPQVCRWYGQLQEFTFEIVHRPGERMTHVDALSRVVRDDRSAEEDELNYGKIYVMETLEEEVGNWQLGDERLQQLSKIMDSEEKQEKAGIRKENGILYKMNNDRKLLIVPNSFRKMLVVKCHDFGGHFGLDRTLANIKRYYYFPGMKRYVKRHLATCLKCIMNKNPSGKKPGELHPIPPTKRPFAVIHMDHLGPFIKSRKGNQYLLVIIDSLTRFVRLHAVKDTSATSTLKHLKVLVQERGVPEMIITDRGAAFTSKNFDAYCKDMNIKHNLISVRHPRANGMVERVNRTVMPVIRCEMEEEQGWDKSIKACEQALNLSVNQSTNLSPFEMLYGYQPMVSEIDTRLRDILQEEYKQPKECQEEARKRMREVQEMTKKRFDKKIYTATKFQVGDLVYLRRAPTSSGVPTKTQPRYRGPMVIIGARGGDSYKIKDLREDSGRQFITAAHVSDLKLWRPEGEESADEPMEDSEATDEESLAEEEDAEVKEEMEEEPQELGRTRARKKPAYLEDYI